MAHPPEIAAYFDEATNTASYLVSDKQSGEAVIIDPVLDFDQRSGRLTAASAQRILNDAQARGLKIVWALETHAHADHLTAAAYIRARTGARTAIGEHVGKVQSVFRAVFNLEGVSTNGAEFDRLLKEGDTVAFGGMEMEVWHTPGHTPACVSYRLGDAVFVGDTLFMPDYGTARTDFPGGDAAALYRSIRRILALAPETRLFLCHDYKAPGRDRYVWQTTVAEQRAHNIHIRDGVDEAGFVAMRQARDATLAAPVLLLPSIQVNIRAGRLPKAESNGTSYLKIPLRLSEELAAADLREN
ncbi:MAG TPA: MBL fold metallo-hydrolase [Rhizomicrobium sp.]|nr:MBL fold metallo-hydrolase [Rhizomicrobium sp.]